MAPANASAGFTLIELAVVLALVGLLAWVSNSSYQNVGELDRRQQAAIENAQIQDALRGFVLANARLPCPDTDDDGRAEDCSMNTDSVGTIPYETLGLVRPAAAARGVYGVYRDAGNDADLAAPGEDRSGNDVVDKNDFIIALNNATGGQGINCDASSPYPAAFFTILPLQDRDGSGQGLDREHGRGDPAFCIHAQGIGSEHDRDDAVRIQSTAGLAGWLKAQ